MKNFLSTGTVIILIPFAVVGFVLEPWKVPMEYDAANNK